MISESEPWMPLNFTFQETCRVHPHPLPPPVVCDTFMPLLWSKFPCRNLRHIVLLGQHSSWLSWLLTKRLVVCWRIVNEKVDHTYVFFLTPFLQIWVYLPGFRFWDDLVRWLLCIRLLILRWWSPLDSYLDGLEAPSRIEQVVYDRTVSHDFPDG